MTEPDGSPVSDLSEDPSGRRETDESGQYLVLARKYRPSTFAGLIGQEAMVRTLTNAIRSGRLAHAFILTGVRGVGKTTTARIIARALNCIGENAQSGPTPEPCGVCEHCRAIAEDRHVDVLEIDAASRTKVEEIRELLDGVCYRPTSARSKVYIIDEVHMLSKHAFNALLKTLEEPPEHVKFIFATTETRKVPVTVLSRCQRFDLRRVDVETLIAHYAGIVEKGDAPEVLTAALEQLLSAPAKHLPREQIGAYFATAMADKDATVRNAATKLFKQAATRRDYPAVASDWESLLHSKDLQVRGTARKTIAMIASDDAQTELARNDGYLTEWQVLGTFRGETLARRTIAYPPETELDFSKTYQAEGIYVIPSEDKKIPPKREIRTRTIAWQKGTVTTVEGLLRVNYFVTPPTRQAIAYAAATVTPKTPGEAIIWVEGVQRQYLWLNGAKAIAPEPQVPKDKYLWLEKYPWRHHKGGTSGVRATYKVTLKPGPNQILIKAIYRGSTEWEFRVRVLGIDGSPLEVQQ